MSLFQGVLFDLDGTLADTAPDLAQALNATLAAFGRPPLPEKVIRPVVSHGSIALIHLGFGMQPEDPGFETRRRYLLDHYANNLCRHTRLFPQMGKLLQELAARGLSWGIVTNKPAWLTNPLVAQLPLPIPPGCVISGDTCAQRKPHPMPLLTACKQLGISPRATLYVGDAQRDMEAGKAAGMATVCARFGYIHPHDHPEAWPADHHIYHPLALLKLLDARSLSDLGNRSEGVGKRG